MKKTLNKLIIASFVIPLSCIGILSFIDQDQMISLAENRELAKKPSLTGKKILDSSYANEYETYYGDHFPMRGMLTGYNKRLNVVYHISDPDGILVVENNFNMGLDIRKKEDESQNLEALEVAPVAVDGILPKPIAPVIDQGQKSNGIIMTKNSAMESFTFSEELIKYFAENIEYFKAQMPDKKIYLMVPPSAAEFYAPEDFKTESSSQKRAFEYLQSQLKDVIYVNAYEELSQHAQEEYLYFRTDHHWTARGAYYGYKAFAKEAGFEVRDIANYDHGFVDDFLGSMYKATSKYGQSDQMKAEPDFVEYFQPQAKVEAMSYTSPEMLDGKEKQLINKGYVVDDNKYNVFLGGDSPILKITTDAKNDKKIVVVRDSYGHAFIPYLTDNYKEIYAVEPRYLNVNGQPKLKLKEFVDQVGADEIIFMNYPMFVSGGYWFKWIDVLGGMQ